MPSHVTFKAKMRRIRFPLGLCSRVQTPLGELTALPQTATVFNGTNIKGMAGEKGWEGKREGKGGEW